MDRRTFMALSAAVTASVDAGKSWAAAGEGAQTGTFSASFAPKPKPGEPRFKIAMVIFDNMTNQDFVGPNDVLARVGAAEIHVLAKSLDPVRTDARGRVIADRAIRDADEHYDMLFVGGGGGVNALMEDREVIDFLRSRAPHAKYVTSVCTGALVLGAAGLLKGYKAATHWAAMDVLPLLGAIPTRERVVIDRNRITGGGVTAGIDFGLTVVSHIWGADFAQLIQLGIEYNPQPPFDAGSPDTAPPHVAAEGRKMLDAITRARMEIGKRITTSI